MERKLSITIDGSRITDIPSFYSEINRTLMAGVGWELGNSLDALDDLLYGGYGQQADYEILEIIWTDMEASRSSLGYETTRQYYLDKLQNTQVYNSALFTRKLQELYEGNGQTYFEILMEIIASHPNVRLIGK